MNLGSACDIAWETLEEIYGREDVVVENAIALFRRPARSIKHCRVTLLEF